MFERILNTSLLQANEILQASEIHQVSGILQASKILQASEIKNIYQIVQELIVLDFSIDLIRHKWSVT